MKITSYVPLTPAQEKTIDALETVVVRKAQVSKTEGKPPVVATIRTFQAQNIKITIAADGGIDDVEYGYDSL